MNRQQAAERVEWHITAAVDQLRPPSGSPVNLEPVRRFAFACDDPTDHGPPGRVVVEHRYELPGVDAADGPSVLDTLAGYWAANGYRILRDGRGRPLAEIAAEAPDGFRVVIATDTLGNLAIIGSSPCVWPSGRPPAGSTA